MNKSVLVITTISIGLFLIWSGKPVYAQDSDSVQKLTDLVQDWMNYSIALEKYYDAEMKKLKDLNLELLTKIEIFESENQRLKNMIKIFESESKLNKTDVYADTQLENTIKQKLEINHKYGSLTIDKNLYKLGDEIKINGIISPSLLNKTVDDAFLGGTVTRYDVNRFVISVFNTYHNYKYESVISSIVCERTELYLEKMHNHPILSQSAVYHFEEKLTPEKFYKLYYVIYAPDAFPGANHYCFTTNGEFEFTINVSKDWRPGEHKISVHTDSDEKIHAILEGFDTSFWIE